LLTPAEQTLFRRLSVFVGGASLEAIETVGTAASGPHIDVIDGLTSLIRQSLLGREIVGEEPDAAMPRLHMLETIREYGAERLAESGEEAAIRTAHANWCLDLAERAAPFWFTADQTRWADRLEVEHDNLRAALAWWTERGDNGTILCVTAAIWPFWFLRSYYSEGLSWLERALASSTGARTRERVSALNGAGSLAVFQVDTPRVVAWCDESLAIAQEIGFPFGAGNALLILGHAAFLQRDYERANGMHEAALGIMRELGDSIAVAIPTMSVLLGNLAEVAVSKGHYARATRMAEEALAMQRQLKWDWGASQSLFILAEVARRQGDVARARALYQESLRQAWDQRDQRLMLRPLNFLAMLAAEVSEAEHAARLFGATARLRELLGTPLDSAEQEAYDRAVIATRSRLGDLEFQVAWAAGLALSPVALVTEASCARDDRSPNDKVDLATQLGLTRRERDVLRFLIEGRSDREIAEALFVGRRTVETHVASILGKLSLNSRTAVAAYAVRNDLV
jgi:non-specific serine/threonine protein kinase